MRVLIAPDGFKGTLDAAAAAAAIADGWRRERPDDQVRCLPLADGGDSLLMALARPDDRWLDVEVVGPLGRPVTARALLRDDGTAVIETAEACGLHLVPEEERDPLVTTTYGVGQLLRAVIDAGARHLLLGLGGSATVDAGAGALTGLGFSLRVADGSGLKVGGAELRRLAVADRGWAGDLDHIQLELLCDVTTPLPEAAAVFGPQKGADEHAVAVLEAALATAAEVLERDLADGRPLRGAPGSGAAGGLAFGLAAGLGAELVPGAARVAALVGLDEALGDCDVVITGEGRLDATSLAGKVVGHVLERAAAAGVAVLAVAGGIDEPHPGALAGAEAAAPDGPGPDPRTEVADAAARLAARWTDDGGRSGP